MSACLHDVADVAAAANGMCDSHQVSACMQLIVRGVVQSERALPLWGLS